MSDQRITININEPVMHEPLTPLEVVKTLEMPCKRCGAWMLAGTRCGRCGTWCR